METLLGLRPYIFYSAVYVWYSYETRGFSSVFTSDLQIKWTHFLIFETSLWTHLNWHAIFTVFLSGQVWTLTLYLYCCSCNAVWYKHDWPNCTSCGDKRSTLTDEAHCQQLTYSHQDPPLVLKYVLTQISMSWTSWSDPRSRHSCM
jgi:hypothetical protein